MNTGKKLLFFFMLLGACTGKNVPAKKYDHVPHLIPEEKMIAILADYHLTECLNNVKDIKQLMGIRQTDSIHWIDSVVVFHGFSVGQFDSTIKTYVNDLDYYLYIYEKVMNELGRREAENKQKSQQR